jgi:hypothetical protein
VFLVLASFLPFQTVRVAGGEAAPLLAPPSQATQWRDLEVASQVLAELREDKQLSDLNLGVRMRGGIASLHGPVPSTELKQRAVKIAKQVTGVLEVRDKDLYLAPSRKKGPTFTEPLDEEKPTRTRSASLDPVSGRLSTLTGRDPSLPLATATNAKDRPSASVTLLAPEVLTTSPRPREPARLTVNPRPAAPSPVIGQAIEQMRQRDERFRAIRTEVTGTNVRIIAGDSSGEDVMEFAQAISRLAGVKRVLVANASTSSR